MRGDDRLTSATAADDPAQGRPAAADDAREGPRARSGTARSDTMPQGRFARLSTSGKILVILTLALLPLGLIASLASIEAAQANRSNRALAVRLLATESAQRLSDFLDGAAGALRDGAHLGRGGCGRAARRIDGAGADVRIAMFDADGGLRCSTGALAATLPLVAARPEPLVTLDPETGGARVIVSTGNGWALALLPRPALARAAHPGVPDGGYDLRLSDRGGREIPLARMRTVMIGRSVVSRLPVADGQLDVALTTESSPLSANEVLLILLPPLMWVLAAGIGWLVVGRLVLRPLGQVRDAIERARDGAPLVMPEIATPAQEIRELGAALASANAIIARHEAELEDGLARQTKLTREVHHRVKNNLQVVASLLNIHARGAHGPEAVAAYGAIQRRVDALALVHRSHYAEMEVNRGVALRPLIGELVANLRGSAPAGAPAPGVAVDVILAAASQDVAVPVAFLVTELFELAMLRGSGGTRVAIALRAVADAPGRARLSLSSPALAHGAAPEDEAYVRGLRVVEGLARQLRGALAVDREMGTFSVEIAVMEKAPAAAPESRDLSMQLRGGALVPRHLAG